MASTGINGYNMNDIKKGFSNAGNILGKEECIFSGSTAIAFLCNSLGIPYDKGQLLHEKSDVDIFYCSKQITAPAYGLWKSTDLLLDTRPPPGKHITFINGDNIPLNFHWDKVSSISYIEVEGFKFKPITTMMDDYTHVFDFEDSKIEYKRSLLQLIKKRLEESVMADPEMPAKRVYREL